MKKIFLIAFFLLSFCVTQLYAQKVIYYDFSSTTGDGNYVELANTTVLTGADKIKGDFKDFILSKTDEAITIDSAKKRTEDLMGFPIGFNFAIAGKVFDRFLPVSNGYIMFGTGKIDKESLNDGFDLSEFSAGLCADAGVKRSSNTKISYSLSGEEGSKILSVEFKNLRYEYNEETDLGTDSLTYTIRLYQIDGHVELYFGSMYASEQGTWFRVGLAGEGWRNTHYRAPVSVSWDTTTFTEGATGKQNFKDKKMTIGTTYKFSKPQECVKPATKAQILCSTTSNSAEIEVKMPQEKEGDGYILMYSQGPMTKFPVDGKTYKADDSIGNAKVLLVQEIRPEETELNEEEIRSLSPNTEYYIYTLMSNSRCSSAPKYGDTTKYVAKTKTSEPEELKLTYAKDTILLMPKANALNENMLVLATTVQGKDEYGNYDLRGLFGSLSGDFKIGDTVRTKEGGFGGKVIYVGANSDKPIVYTNIVDNMIYHFGAFSRAANGDYSTVYVKADTITKASVPFHEEFVGMPEGEIPYGWNGVEISVGRGGDLEGVIRSVGEEAYLETPQMVFPLEKDARLMVEYNLSQYQGRSKVGLKSKDWNEKDSIIISVSENGEIWKKEYAITKLNADNFANSNDYQIRYINLKGHQGKNCRVRIEYKMALVPGNTHLKINNIRIIEKPECDFPVNVSCVESSITDDKATIKWGTIGEETQWKIRYRTVSGEWSKDQIATSNPFELSGLPNRDSVKVAVRAVCGFGMESEIAESAYFISGYQIPFKETFTDKMVNYGNMYASKYGVPQGMTASDIKLEGEKTIVKAKSGAESTFFVSITNKTTDKLYKMGEAGSDGCVSLPSLNSEQKHSWLLMPGVVLEEGKTTNFGFDLRLRQVEAGVYSTPTTVSNSAAVKVIVSANDTVFSINDTILSLTKEQVLAIGNGQNFNVPIKGRSGKVYIGIYYVQGEEGGEETMINYLYVDNIKVSVPCGEVKRLEVKNIEKTSAKLTWNVFPDVNEYTVELTKTGSTETKFIETNTNSINLTGLEEATEYKAEVYYVCGAEDTSARVGKVFSTTKPCVAVVSNLTATNVSQNSATLAWEGESGGYNIDVKEASSSTYNRLESTEKTVKATGLKPGIKYEFRVQSVCGEGVADTGEWSAVAEFTTLELTCFVPTQVVITPSFNTAEVVWQGTASNYQVAYREGQTGTTNPWSTMFVQAKNATVSNLQAKKNYQLRVRSVCAAGDTSTYTETEQFLTTDIPVCPQVTALVTTDITETSAKLSWTGNDEHLSYLIRYRASSATVWDSVKNLTEETHALSKLSPKTAYVWSVNASCSVNRISGWASQADFTTEGASVEEKVSALFSIYSSKGALNIINKSGIRIGKVAIYNTSGREIGSYELNTTDNVLITTELKRIPVVVVVYSEHGTRSYKVLIP